jgi:pimeloyl-ACP methyl ester carboxylesterase
VPRRHGRHLTRGRLLLGALGILLVLLVSGAIYQSTSERRDMRRWPAPGVLVSIGDRRLHLRCVGTGAPVVVLEAGLGDGLLTWDAVQDSIAAFTRVCAYDRAGFGWSDPGPAPRTSAQEVGELHALLRAAALPAPYVLVGHSMGGLNVRMYTFRFPGEVAGLVLVDPSQETQFARMPMPATIRVLYALMSLTAPVGLPRLVAHFVGPTVPADSAEAAARGQALGLRTSALRATGAELASFGESMVQVGAARRPLGALPLVVISASRMESGLGVTRAEAAERRRIFSALQEEIARSSSAGRRVTAEGSGHYVQLERPAIVIGSVRQVVETARARARSGREP